MSNSVAIISARGGNKTLLQQLAIEVGDIVTIADGEPYEVMGENDGIISLQPYQAKQKQKNQQIRPKPYYRQFDRRKY